MTEHAFAAGDAPCVEIAGCRGTLTIETWDERAIAVSGAAADLGPEQAVRLRGASGDVRVRLPGDARVTIARHDGAVLVDGGGELWMQDVFGPVTVDSAVSLTIARDTQPRPKRLPWEPRHDISVRHVPLVTIAEAPENVVVAVARQATIGAVGGSFGGRAISGELRLGDVGGSCEIADIGRNVAVSNVGGSCEARRVAGELRLGDVGGSATLEEIGAVVGLGAVGGSLTVERATLAAERIGAVLVGGSARLALPESPRLTLRALVGGRVTAPGLRGGSGRRMVQIGGGGPEVRLSVGGSLNVLVAEAR